MKFFQQKISPVLALITVAAFGFTAIYLMNSVFEKYSYEELLVKQADSTVLK